ncbi:hypothetical protein GCM10023226_22440 [Nocardioides nanhaiensis]|uniref:Class I SAM-dependent methyltransferase n=1 Tax=Nocardioides nanhaiensis TaxID=1476871 RepID=A0ABP8W938_9ACTN
MHLDEIRNLHERLLGRNYGSLTVEEVAWLQELVVEHQPRRVLELGTASGLTTGFLARFVAEQGGSRVVTVDHDDTFFGDPSKPNGFLVDQVYPGGPVVVERRTFTTSPSVAMRSVEETYEMAFIDANHQHPWPTIDALCVIPALVGPRVLLMDDLRLYFRQAKGRGIGPKHLFDQFPEARREQAPVSGGNVFRLRVDGLPAAELERIAADCLAIPWTLTNVIAPERLDAVRSALSRHYSAGLVAHFDECTARYNAPTGRAYATRRP